MALQSLDIIRRSATTTTPPSQRQTEKVAKLIDVTKCIGCKACQFPKVDTPTPMVKNVVVLGAGNVAMDSARTAMRLGADSVKIVYRRSRAEMPARSAEIHHAGEEGIEFNLLTAPTKYLSDEKGP